MNNTPPKHWWQETTVQTALITTFITGIITLIGIFIVRETTKSSQENEQRKEYVDIYTKHLENTRNLKSEIKKNGELYYQLTLINNCNVPINVAIQYISFDDISVTKGWIILEKGMPTSTGTPTSLASLFIYAYNTKQPKPWEPDYKVSIVHTLINKNIPFDYINVPFIESDIQNSVIRSDNINKPFLATFYSVDLSTNRDKQSGVTTKAFRCDTENHLILEDVKQKTQPPQLPQKLK